MADGATADTLMKVLRHLLRSHLSAGLRNVEVEYWLDLLIASPVVREVSRYIFD